MLLLLLLTACQGDGLPDLKFPGVDDTASEDSGDTVTPALTGFIGSPCEQDDDCDYDGGLCLTDGFPLGMCSLPCELYCPDQDGFPTTFCVENAELPASPRISDGGCVSRCDLGAYPDNGCRDDYGCVVASRANEPDTETFVCLPDREPELSDCHADLAARGVSFEPTVIPVDSPSGHPNLVCGIDDPVYLLSPVHGVELKYIDGNVTERVLAGCEMAHALVDTIDDVAESGVTSLLHIGTYNCRVISGTSTLSQHAFANAIDIYGFEFDDGRLWTLVDDWEHDTQNFTTEAARWLYESGYRWHDQRYWNLILTPNYNSAHDNHFHVDLTPGSDAIAFTDGRYFGPAPYAD